MESLRDTPHNNNIRNHSHKNSVDRTFASAAVVAVNTAGHWFIVYKQKPGRQNRITSNATTFALLWRITEFLSCALAKS